MTTLFLTPIVKNQTDLLQLKNAMHAIWRDAKHAVARCVEEHEREGKLAMVLCLKSERINNSR